MKDYRKTQQLYKLLNLFDKNNKKEPLSRKFYILWVISLGGFNLFIYSVVVYIVIAKIHLELTNMFLFCLLISSMFLGLFISIMTAIVMIFIYSKNYLKLKKYKQLNFSIIACKEVTQTERYTSTLKKYFTQSFLEEKLLELDFQIQTKNTRLIPFILAVSFIFSSLTLLKEIDISLLQDFFNVIISPSNISQMLLQNVTMMVISFSVGICIGILIVKWQTYKYTYWTKLLKLTIQLMEHEKKHKAIQTNNNSDSNNSYNWKKKIITWLQN